jgi:hypothetical protein
MTYLIRFVAVWSCWVGGVAAEAGPLPSDHGEASKASTWERLVGEADRLHLPTNFLKEIPADFIQFEFDDLQTYAAEYHPDEHRMVLNRSLSFNGAARTLKPLAKMTHKELEVLYHELFHAYMDSLAASDTRTAGTGHGSNGLMAFARSQQVCRYADVTIVPIAQRPHEVELRYLTESESWEALNETWAVFVGWVVWNQLELSGHGGPSIQQPGKNQDEWVSRLKAAEREGSLRGYYEPEDPAEHTMARKRYLAPASRLSEQEAAVLMRDVMEFSPALLVRAKGVLSGMGQGIERYHQCR